MRRKQRSQAVVEFGLIALLFTALMFAIVDFGLLLNTWLAVSSGTRDIARSASVGKGQPFLEDQARHLNLPAVSTSGFARVCCHPDPGGTPSARPAVEVQVDYLTGCSPTLSVCTVVSSASNVSVDYPFRWADQAGSGPAVLGGGCTPAANCHPQAGDYVRVTVTAHGAQVITPLIRLAFENCRDGSNPQCNVDLGSSVTMRVEGQEY